MKAILPHLRSFFGSDTMKKTLTTELSGEGVAFPDGYPFRHSSIAGSGTVPLEDIRSVQLFTLPPSIVIAQREVIFLPGKTREDVQRWTDQHDLPVSDRPDTWSLLAEPFLDTAFTEEEKSLTIARLAEQGFDESEVRKIRRRIAPVLSFNYLAWEWVYLGLWDFFSWHPLLRKSTYWWAMEIALREPD